MNKPSKMILAVFRCATGLLMGTIQRKY